MADLLGCEKAVNHPATQMRWRGLCDLHVQDDCRSLHLAQVGCAWHAAASRTGAGEC